jgi:hypothetical protein
VNDCVTSTFCALRPGMPGAFQVFIGRDGRPRAHRVELL